MGSAIGTWESSGLSGSRVWINANLLLFFVLSSFSLVVLCRVLSCRVVSSCDVSCGVVSCCVVSFRVVWSRVVWCRVVSFRVLQCFVLCFFVLNDFHCFVFSFSHVFLKVLIVLFKWFFNDFQLKS